jgi:hypothetical protein
MLCMLMTKMIITYDVLMLLQLEAPVQDKDEFSNGPTTYA